MKKLRSGTPCALLVNDLHISKENISEFQKNWQEAIGICVENEITRLIVGGDLWESRAAQSLNVLIGVAAALRFAELSGVTVDLAAGNHCKVDQESVLSYNHVFADYSSVQVIDTWKKYDCLGCKLYVMSYFPENGSFIQKFERLKETVDFSEVNVLYLHQGINGALGMLSDKDLSPEIFEGFDKVLVGHYHNRCKIKGTNIEYIGSSRQFNFGEDEEKGYTMLYSNGDTKFIKNKVNIRYAVLNFNADDFNASNFLDTKHKIQDIIKNPLYRLKLKITGSKADLDLLAKSSILEMGVSKVEFINEQEMAIESVSSTLSKKYDKDGIKGEYISFCEIKGASPELGLNYLEKI